MALQIFGGGSSAAALSNTFARPTRPTLMGLGDSMTANGLNVDWAAVGFRYQPVSWIWWGATLSGARFLHVGDAATAGYTIQQIKATHLPTVLAAKPAFCTVLAGQNNLGTLSATDLTDLLSIYKQLAGAGITPILCAIPATQATANRWKLNQWIARTARENGWPFVDMDAATTDTSTGLYKTGYSGDGTHPTETGAKAMGQALATVMQGVIPTTWLPFANANTGPTVLTANPLFLTDNAGTPPYPTPWGAQAALGGSSFAAATTPGLGRTWTMTRGAADGYVAPGYATMVAGNRILTLFRLSTNVEAVTGAWSLYMFDNLGNSRYQIDATKDVPAGSVVANEWVVPSGLPSYQMRWQLRVRTAANAALSIGQFTFMDLTAIGAA